MNVTITAVRDRDDKFTGKTVAFINDRYENKQLIIEMEKLLDATGNYTNSDEYDTYNGFGISYIFDTRDKADFKEDYKRLKPLAKDAIDRTAC